MRIKTRSLGTYADFQQFTGNPGVESYGLPQMLCLLPLKSGAGLRAFDLVQGSFTTLHNGQKLR